MFPLINSILPTGLTAHELVAVFHPFDIAAHLGFYGFVSWCIRAASVYTAMRFRTATASG